MTLLSKTQKAKRTLCDFFASGFYSGHIPCAPGTCGTAMALALSIACQTLIPEFWASKAGMAMAIITIVFGVFISNRALKYQLYTAGQKDPQQIVIDEFAGFFVSILFIGLSLPKLILAFCLFRFFDILKPFPIRLIEKLPDGYGIVMDDVMAGIYANTTFHILLVAISSS